MRVGDWVSIAGMLYVVYQLHRRGSAKTVATDPAPASCLDFHRRELERQRDMLLGIWSWYLGPLIPGMVLIAVAGGLVNPGHPKRAWLFEALYAAIVALGFYFVAKLNQRAAQRLQRQIDELNAMGANISCGPRR
jgi:hypothetical protein